MSLSIFLFINSAFTLHIISSVKVDYVTEVIGKFQALKFYNSVGCLKLFSPLIELTLVFLRGYSAVKLS